jgi:hypothetical protein
MKIFSRRTGMVNKEPDWDESSQLRASLEALYPNAGGSGSSMDFFSLPDEMLWWTLSLLRKKPVPTPELDDSAWNRWIQVLSPHYIIPLAWYLSRNVPEECLPPQRIRNQMKEMYQKASIRVLRTDNQVIRIRALLVQSGIEPVVLKGPALGHLVYPFPSLRTGSDIDILVRPDQVREVITMLRKQGYHSHVDTHAISPHVFHHTLLLPPDRKDALSIEVHWRLLYLPGEVTPRMEDVFERAVEVSTASGTFTTLDIPDALMYAAAHMCIGHSRMLRLSWVADIMYLSRHLTEQGMWEEVFRRTSGGVLLPAVRQACREAGFWFEPDAVYMKPGFFPETERSAEERFQHLVAVAERTERHILEAVRQAPTPRDALLSVIHISLLTDQIGGGGSFHDHLTHFRMWLRIMSARLKKRYKPPTQVQGRGSS